MNDEKYVRAKKRVKEIKDFYTHLIVFGVVLTILTVINLATFAIEGDLNFWFLYPLGFWGFAVFMHGMKTFFLGKGSRWENRKIKEVMKQMDEDE